MTKPLIGVTMGDPASAGPEITVKAIVDHALWDTDRLIVVGDAWVMEQAVRTLGYEGRVTIHPIECVAEARFGVPVINVFDMKQVQWGDFETGCVSAACGEAAYQYVKKVIELAMAHQIDATVTNAISKEAINAAGHHYSGHTEIYADHTGTKRYAMMLAHQDLRVVHVSTHVSLREACDRVKKDRVLEVIRLGDQACRALGILRPKIGVAGLNPHCGENGLFGREEIEEIQPAIDAAIEEGICIPDAAPVPADTVFSKARGGWYDIVVVMYHDQGHIPLKLIGFVYDRERQVWDAVEGINVTLGLPIIRVSVDHGTAFEHAGRGTASEKSLLNSIVYARTLAAHQPFFEQEK